jgi:hypothetical protein
MAVERIGRAEEIRRRPAVQRLRRADDWVGFARLKLLSRRRLTLRTLLDIGVIVVALAWLAYLQVMKARDLNSHQCPPAGRLPANGATPADALDAGAR